MKLNEQGQKLSLKLDEMVNKFDFENFKNESIRRQFEKMSGLGTSALNEQDFKTVITLNQSC